MRDRGTTRIADGVDLDGFGLPLLCHNGTERKIDVLVENVARVNHRSPMDFERKGLEDCVLYAGVKLFYYETRTLPLKDLSHIAWSTERPAAHKPCFFKGTFDAKASVDTYVSFENLGHGYVWVNGFNVGRYDEAGPFMTLYLPGHFLKEKDNEIIVLDIHPKGEITEISLLDHEILEGDSVEMI